MGGVAGLLTQQRIKAIKAAKKTVQIIKLHRLFIQQKKTLGELIFGLSFLVGDPVKNKKKGKKLILSVFTLNQVKSFEVT